MGSPSFTGRSQGEIMRAHDKRLLIGLLLWYVAISVWTAQSPADPQFWLLSSILPTLCMATLVATHRVLPLSRVSYVFIAAFLTLHMIGAHYTYAGVPVGAWLQQTLDLNRNHFDRIVHFSFGFLLAYPIEEFFRLTAAVRGWLVYYLPVMTVLGLSGLWEIIESWIASAVHPELGITYLGSQGDIWDAQKDMAVALIGALLCMAALALARATRGAHPAPQAQPVVDRLS
jgi:putative membrane protein